jgi:hypothetical protein
MYVAVVEPATVISPALAPATQARDPQSADKPILLIFVIIVSPFL